jgi:hypothetical protein
MHLISASCVLHISKKNTVEGNGKTVHVLYLYPEVHSKSLIFCDEGQLMEYISFVTSYRENNCL